jgi:hypothetical protein
MLGSRFSRSKYSERGQSMIETALLLPILLLLAFNAINFGYFFFVVLNLSSAPRSGVQYSILGFSTPGQFSLPPAGPAGTSDTVSYLTYRDIEGVLTGWGGAHVVVCGKQLGVDSNQAECCETASSSAACSSTGTHALADPEVGTGGFHPFVLNRVDITYRVNPIIPAFELPTPAGPISLTLIPDLNFHRQVSMRAMD